MQNEVYTFKGDNRGISLVELIITIAILALVTAPFLHSFISASKTNKKASDVLNTKNVSQDIMEEMQGSTIAKLQNITFPGLTAFTETDPSGAVKTGYKVSNVDLSSLGYSPRYTADITLTKSKNRVNDEVSTIKKVDNKKSVVFMDIFTTYDGMYSTLTSTDISRGGYVYRCSTVDIDYNSVDNIFTFRLSIQYLKSVPGRGTSNIKKLENIVKVDYKETDKIPDMYIFYTALNQNDEFIINNNISDLDLSDNYANLYFISQVNTSVGGTTIDSIKPEKVKLNFVQRSGSPTSPAVYLDEVSSAVDIPYVVYTNILSSDYDRYISLNDITYLYDVDIVIKFDGKKYGTYSSSKVNG